MALARLRVGLISDTAQSHELLESLFRRLIAARLPPQLFRGGQWIDILGCPPVGLVARIMQGPMVDIASRRAE
ncbi:MAG: hypothetical protein HOI87_21685 [Rhodospirillaceae bacterium]|jgi:hypothetical protein|nr:hypothetical protein [Rhodospirillaceae bacterium]MBT6262470.1 hypothetical protein [Rhodospirillaceae bacterium]MBT6677898.1 hypothetical protein [Rhodospirillaceae bacterium]